MGLLTVQTVEKFELPKSKMAEAAVLKTVKSPYLRNRLTDFDEIWHRYADLLTTGYILLKFRIFQKTRWRRPPSLKKHKNRDITTTDWQIFAKFSATMQNGTLNHRDS